MSVEDWEPLVVWGAVLFSLFGLVLGILELYRKIRDDIHEQGLKEFLRYFLFCTVIILLLPLFLRMLGLLVHEVIAYVSNPWKYWLAVFDQLGGWLYPANADLFAPLQGLRPAQGVPSLRSGLPSSATLRPQ